MVRAARRDKIRIVVRFLGWYATDAGRRRDTDIAGNKV